MQYIYVVARAMSFSADHDNTAWRRFPSPHYRNCAVHACSGLWDATPRNTTLSMLTSAVDTQVFGLRSSSATILSQLLMSYGPFEPRIFGHRDPDGGSKDHHGRQTVHS